jgi:hypothetical protein
MANPSSTAIHQEFLMSKTLSTRLATLAAALSIALPALLSPSLAFAREGAGSVGHGIKCSTRFDPVSNTWYQYCYKGV